jgi:magnesium chelatase family protein
MVSNLKTLTFSGVETIAVDVQCHMEPGFPGFTVVGLADKIVTESKERVRAALSSIGMALPIKKITLNLAPADLNKEGSHFDLPIACALLVNMGVLPADSLASYFLMGELSLDGSIVGVSGVLPASIGALAREMGIICPYDNGSEAAFSGNVDILAPRNLLEIINHFNGRQILSPPKMQEIKPQEEVFDFCEIKGQALAKRALEVAASGAHNMIMCGPPGSGKSMLAKYLSHIIPKMSAVEILECSMIASVAGKLANGNLQTSRPFRAPHHSCSMPAMVGGGMGKKITPGEISLAHNGVLFLDELPEFSRTVLDSLRQPIESGKILISRVSNHVTYPARFQLIAAMNPCKCGYLSDSSRSCSRAPKCGNDYQSKISGPILDRIDLHVDVPSVSAKDISASNQDNSKELIARVAKVRELQKKRYQGLGIRTNAELDGKILQEFAVVNDDAIGLLNQAVDKFRLSMRAYNRILKVARTIADMGEEKNINKSHLAEAISYRQINV